MPRCREAAVAAWIAFLRSDDHTIDDPLADELRSAARSAQPYERLVGEKGLLASRWRPPGLEA